MLALKMNAIVVFLKHRQTTPMNILAIEVIVNE